MIYLEFDAEEIKRLRKIKLIAKWFLAIQSIWIILQAITICGALSVIIANKALLVFAILFFYFAGMGILTLSIIIKRPGSQSISSAKTRLIVVFALGIVPTIIGFLPILRAIIVK
jgi:hypothetical protein